MIFFVQLTHTSFYVTLVGTIPSSISKLTNLYYLWLNSNSLTGVILFLLFEIITSNTITSVGTIPSLICDLPLEELYLQENNFTCAESECVINLANDIDTRDVCSSKYRFILNSNCHMSLFYVTHCA